jgi:hypothetical protein
LKEVIGADVLDVVEVAGQFPPEGGDGIVSDAHREKAVELGEDAEAGGGGAAQEGLVRFAGLETQDGLVFDGADGLDALAEQGVEAGIEFLLAEAGRGGGSGGGASGSPRPRNSGSMSFLPTAERWRAASCQRPKPIHANPPRRRRATTSGTASQANRDRSSFMVRQRVGTCGPRTLVSFREQRVQ